MENIRKLEGVLPILLEYSDKGFDFIIPQDNTTEALASKSKFKAFSSLSQAVLSLKTGEYSLKIDEFSSNVENVQKYEDFSDIKGHTLPKRAF